MEVRKRSSPPPDADEDTGGAEWGWRRARKGKGRGRGEWRSGSADEKGLRGRGRSPQKESISDRELRCSSSSLGIPAPGAHNRPLPPPRIPVQLSDLFGSPIPSSPLPSRLVAVRTASTYIRSATLSIHKARCGRSVAVNLIGRWSVAVCSIPPLDASARAESPVASHDLAPLRSPSTHSSRVTPTSSPFESSCPLIRRSRRRLFRL